MPKDYLDEVTRYNIRKAKPGPARCALLVIDMQRFFRPIPDPIIDNVNAIIAHARSSGMAVVYTRHGHLDLSKDGGMLAQWWGELAVKGSADWELLDNLDVADDDIIVDKNRYDAFNETDLDSILRDRDVDQLIITGVLTNCCCETTARAAFVRDYRVFFLSDATATANEDLHVASLKNLAFGFAHILSTQQLISMEGRK
jgi:nicotinamidase-related amidase